MVFVVIATLDISYQNFVVQCLLKGLPFNVQSFWEITSDSYFEFIKKYVVGIGPWKDTIVCPVKNYLTPPTDLVARAHALDLQVCSPWSN